MLVARPCPPKYVPAAAASTAPIINWPSAPMFHTFMRNVMAAASPVSSSGVAATSVLEKAPGLVNADRTMRW